MEGKVGVPPKNNWKQTGHEAAVAVNEEMKRVQRLPSNSTYATHRLRVLNKILQLLSIQSALLRISICYSHLVCISVAVFQKGKFERIAVKLKRTASQEEELGLLFAGLSL